MPLYLRLQGVSLHCVFIHVIVCIFSIFSVISWRIKTNIKINTCRHTDHYSWTSVIDVVDGQTGTCCHVTRWIVPAWVNSVRHRVAGLPARFGWLCNQVNTWKRYNKTYSVVLKIQWIKNVKSFPSYKGHRAGLISVSLALSQTPVYTARPRTRG